MHAILSAHLNITKIMKQIILITIVTTTIVQYSHCGHCIIGMHGFSNEMSRTSPKINKKVDKKKESANLKFAREYRGKSGAVPSKQERLESIVIYAVSPKNNVHNACRLELLFFHSGVSLEYTQPFYTVLAGESLENAVCLQLGGVIDETENAISVTFTSIDGFAIGKLKNYGVIINHQLAAKYTVLSGL